MKRTDLWLGLALLGAGCLAGPGATAAAAAPLPTFHSADAETWKRCIKSIVQKPGCCGACSVLSMDDARVLFRRVVGTDTPADAAPVTRTWAEHGDRILAEFRRLAPERSDVVKPERGAEKEKP